MQEICLYEALVIAEHGAHHTRPRLGYAEISPSRTLDHIAVIVYDDRLDAEEGSCRRSRFQRCRPRDRSDQNAAGFGLPPGVDDRATLIADMIVVPQPSLGVDRLANRAEYAQRAPAGASDIVFALAHQRADRRGRGIEYPDVVLVDDLPEARRVRVVGYALEHQAHRAVGERAVDDIAMPCHPADIGGAPIDL